MKRTLLSTICIGSLALAITAQGADYDQVQRARAARKSAATQPATSVRSSNTARVSAQRNYSGTRFGQRSYNVTPQTRSSAVVRQNSLRSNRVQSFRERNLANNGIRARNNVTFNRERNVNVNRQRNLAVNRERNFTVNRERNFTVNRERNFTVNRERNLTVNRERNVTINNNWRGLSGQRYAAFRNYHREWHDRDWWRHNHSRIVFVFGSPYFWDAGYWYPAWGYYPNAYYPYDGPIYGYNNLTPDQVTVNVQEQLQRDGYYSGPIDGVLGPMTRQAIAAYQADHGLAITSAVDEPTLETLGLS